MTAHGVTGDAITTLREIVLTVAECDEFIEQAQEALDSPSQYHWVDADRAVRKWTKMREGADALARLEALTQAAREMAVFLWDEKETREPPRELLDQGYVALESSHDYEREEKLGDALRAALAAVDGKEPEA